MDHRLSKIIDNDLNLKNQETYYEVTTTVGSNNSNLTKPLELGNQNDSIPEADLPLAKATFMTLGFAGILNWSIYLNSNLAIFTTIYNYPNGADTVLFGYFALGLISCLLRVYYRVINPWTTYLGFGIIIFSNIIIPVLLVIAKGTLGIILIHIFISILGLGVSLLVSSAYSFGAMLPFNFTGYSLAGNGLAALIGFLGWQFFTRVFFDVNELDEIQYAVICISAFAVALTLCNVVLFFYLCRKSWFISSLKTFNETSAITLDPDTLMETKGDGKFYKPDPAGLRGIRPIKYLLKDAFNSLFMGFLTFFLTFTLFPEIGPYDWNGLDLNNVSVIVGIYQLFDFLGRYSGNLDKMFRFPYKVLIIGALTRLIFYPLFIVVANADDPFMTNFFLQIFLMIIFAYTHGAFSTQLLAASPKFAKTLVERAVIGVCMNMTSISGMCFSKIFSLILKYIFSI